ncbi:MAG: hypothetical protein CTY22_11815 [Methylomonas sp.]|nr:MAG: hypothetical protein CTY23_05790 [Methylomonas sp.]PPD23757.1 MAG: hypothetical protein CTY22_11815 [Methylomonas sp.]PPD31719.1 MAG: hypothetical protein CTY21_11840 [Methylomonas sp.]PPD41734.1 MAG: hypothetical protein CTY17_03105 [Methylomonas sp.]PPD54552.1 MAG: hypothetical protein CTY11_03670 [Methylomonas sp.]
MAAVLAGCTPLPPKNTDNLCHIFREKPGWYEATLASSRRWGIPIAVQMAIIRQESNFVADARPPRPLILGFIPWFRASSALGYPQAQDETWADYQRETGNSWAQRDDFADSCDFVAWYCAVSQRKLALAASDAKQLYLAYHEGHGGFRRQSYLAKPWLIDIARKVDQRAWRYDAQLAGCRNQLAGEN